MLSYSCEIKQKWSCYRDKEGVMCFLGGILLLASNDHKWCPPSSHSLAWPGSLCISLVSFLSPSFQQPPLVYTYFSFFTMCIQPLPWDSLAPCPRDKRLLCDTSMLNFIRFSPALCPLAFIVFFLCLASLAKLVLIILSPIVAVPNLFGTGDQFCGRQFFHGWVGGWFGDDSSILHSLFTLFLLLLHQHHIRSSGIRSWRLSFSKKPFLTPAMASVALQLFLSDPWVPCP